MLSSVRLRVWRLLLWTALWVRLVDSGIQRLDMKSLRFMGPDFGLRAAVLYV